MNQPNNPSPHQDVPAEEVKAWMESLGFRRDGLADRTWCKDGDTISESSAVFLYGSFKSHNPPPTDIDELDTALLEVLPPVIMGVINPDGLRQDIDTNASKRDRIKTLTASYTEKREREAKLSVIEKVKMWLPGFSARASIVAETVDEIRAYKSSLEEVLEAEVEDTHE